jgi:hypothetical protein
MVSGQQLQVWQSDGVLHIESRYQDDPQFTLEQEKALYEIAENMLIANRLRERRRRYAEKRKKRGEEE